MITVTSLSPTVFVSGGDEKTVRVFEQPRVIAEMLQRLTGAQASSDTSTLPEGAMVPALGLSNKQQEVSEDQEDDSQDREQLASDVMSQVDYPPTEDQLQRHTLWPEIEKLYGHGYEIVAIAVSHDKSLVATTCRANQQTSAVVRLYSTKSWQEIKPPLAAHSLTVTRVLFSPDDKYVLTVSRDRGLAVWHRQGETMALAHHNPKAHARIIWDCCWLPYGLGFITASRDKSIKLWVQSDSNWTEQGQIKFNAPVTAVDISSNNEIIAGLETGEIHIYRLVDNQFSFVACTDRHQSPEARISSVQWRPAHRGEFAVTSEDTSVRIYRIRLSS
jgi:elongator complex protein 2